MSVDRWDGALVVPQLDEAQARRAEIASASAVAAGREDAFESVAVVEPPRHAPGSRHTGAGANCMVLCASAFARWLGQAPVCWASGLTDTAAPPRGRHRAGAGAHSGSVVWLHGLGESGADWRRQLGAALGACTRRGLGVDTAAGAWLRGGADAAHGVVLTTVAPSGPPRLSCQGIFLGSAGCSRRPRRGCCQATATRRTAPGSVPTRRARRQPVAGGAGAAAMTTARTSGARSQRCWRWCTTRSR